MTQFIIKVSDGTKKRPNTMNAEEKRLLREKCINNDLKLFCICNQQCEYWVRDKTWAIYPTTKKQKHKDWCPKSDVYKKNSKYNKGFTITEKDEFKVYLSESIFKNGNKRKTKVITKSFDISGREYPTTQQGKITISAMVKKMNMATFEHIARSSEEKLYPNAEEMSNKMFWAAKRTLIGKKGKCLGDLSIEKDNCKFVYYMLYKLPNTEGKGDNDTVDIETTKKMKNGQYQSFPVKINILKRALSEYKDTYSTDNMASKKIALAGFKNRSEIYILKFLLVNDFGLFCESELEVQMYNTICQIINENNFKEKGVHFYKPYEYGYGAYGDKYLEDGIIEFDNTTKRIIVEVYGRNDDAYLSKKEIKEQIMSSHDNIYEYIPWNANSDKKEELPKDKIKQTILDLLNEQENEHTR